MWVHFIIIHQVITCILSSAITNKDLIVPFWDERRICNAVFPKVVRSPWALEDSFRELPQPALTDLLEIHKYHFFPKTSYHFEDVFYKGTKGSFKISVTLLQLFNSAICKSSPRSYVNEWAWLCSNKSLFTKADRLIWTPGCNQPASNGENWKLPHQHSPSPIPFVQKKELVVRHVEKN